MLSFIKFLFFLVMVCEVSPRVTNSSVDGVTPNPTRSGRTRTVTSTRKRAKLRLFAYYSKYCTVTFKDLRKNIDQNRSLPMIYFVTPTYPRPEQIPELVRLSHTLMHVPRLYWIVADDSYRCSESVAKVLKQSGLPHAHITSPQPNKDKAKLPKDYYNKGVANRRAGLKWIRKFQKKGILYFGDDDKTYDLKLFTEIRKTKKVSMFPVGLTDTLGVTAPLVKNGKVIAFFSSRAVNYPVDISGFAMNIDYLKNSTVMPYKTGPTANSFLTSAGVTFDDIEPLADNCTKILVWNTHSLKYPQRELKGNLLSVAHSKYENLGPLLNTLRDDNVVKINITHGDNASITFKGKIVDNVARL